MVISSPVSPTSAPFALLENSIRETQTSAPDAPAKQNGESASATEAASRSSGATESEEENPASLATASQSKAADVPESSPSTLREPKEGHRVMNLETPLSLSTATLPKVEEVANHIAVEILAEAVHEAAGKVQNVSKDSEDTAGPPSVNNLEAGETCEEDRGSPPQARDGSLSLLKQEMEYSQDETHQAEEPGPEGDVLLLSEKSICPEGSLQEPSSFVQEEGIQEDGSSSTNGCMTSALSKAGAVQPRNPKAKEVSCQDHEDADLESNSEGSMEEIDVSPKVTNTQVR